jgi:SPP1 family phage portal protein
MVLQKTLKDILLPDDILKFIEDYEVKTVPHLNNLWEYYKGKNVKIIGRKTPDPNNPDNKIVISYARKLVTTWTGYGYRSKYITYKPVIKKSSKELEAIENDETIIEDPIEKKYLNILQNIYNVNNEHIKTNRAGRNTAIFGVSYEVLYVDAEINSSNTELPVKVLPKFFTVDPREMIVLYDYSPEPKIKIAIRYYKMDDNNYKVEVYYENRIEGYIRKRDSIDQRKWILVKDGEVKDNFFSNIPVIAYYLGDDIQSIFENVLTMIDAYDVLFSDSMNEFDRFAFAYLIMKKFGLTNPLDKKDPEKASYALKLLKRRRVFENLPQDADIKFLTKEIPTQFITWMGQQLHDQIHIQSHIPDFNMMTGALSGAAIDRLLFDFENLVSSAEADFDVALIQRGNLITNFLKSLRTVPEISDFNTMVSISHKRNLPLDRNSFADLSEKLSRGGYSRRMIVSQMPEDMVPDVEAELDEEKKETEALVMNDLGNADLTEYDSDGNAITDQFGNPLETNKQME